jgi:hypothetical protein
MIKNKKYWSLVGGVRLRSRLGTKNVRCTMDDIRCVENKKKPIKG